MADNSDVVDTAPADVYKESDEHVPDPTAAFGTLDTSGTAGAQNERIEHITPIFDAAKAQDLQYAADAVNPDKPEVPESAVVLPDEGKTAEEAREDVRQAAAAFEKNPVEVKDPSVTDAEKAKEGGTSTDPAKVETQQKQSSATGDNKAGSRTKDQPTK